MLGPIGNMNSAQATFEKAKDKVECNASLTSVNIEAKKFLASRNSSRKEPKRPPSAYILFVHQEWKKLPPGDQVGDVARQLVNMWVKLESEAKKPFEVRADALKTKWEAEMAEYMRTDSHEEEPKEDVKDELKEEHYIAYEGPRQTGFSRTESRQKGSQTETVQTDCVQPDRVQTDGQGAGEGWT